MNAGVTTSAGPALMRQINIANTLRVLYDGQTSTLTQIIETTGLGRMAGEAAVGELVERALVVEEPPTPNGRGTMGRPARMFRFRSEAGFVLSIDVDIDHVAATVADLRGEVRARQTAPVIRSTRRADRLSAIEGVARRAIAAAGEEPENVWATTVSTPGLVEDGERVRLCNVLPEWSDFSLRDALQGRLPGPMHVENHVNLAARGEHWRGVAGDVQTLVWVLVAPRFKAAVIINGQLYRGVNGAAGEIGWLPDLRWQDAAKRLVRMVGSRSDAARSEAVGKDPLPPDSGSVELLAESIAPGLSALALTLNPECLVIGGPIARASFTDQLLENLRTQMGRHCLYVPDLRVSGLGAETALVGGIRAALDRVEERLFPTATGSPRVHPSTDHHSDRH
ncbi:ROK family protein [Occultella kanbiaonis]|uniref:ROK family protein n=1 Tax=Occultella kanbiaonis TaxID=2675754 RepID=UPI0013D7CD4F|nr:ROK family protein [Occultella kanbiaonis]